MQRLEVSGAVRPIYVSLGVKRLNLRVIIRKTTQKTKPQEFHKLRNRLTYT